MPVKDDMDLTPDKVGLTQKDIIYLLIYKELEIAPQHPGGIYKKIKEDIDENLIKSRAHFYKAVEEMHVNGWISYVVNGRRKVYSMTKKGIEELKNYRDKYLVPFQEVKKLSGFIKDQITGSGRGQSVPDVSKEVRKLFNRLINVKELTIYLFLKILQVNPEPYARMTAKEIYEAMAVSYGWVCSVGYIYETAHAIEDGGWADGEWKGARRTDYLYLLTDNGVKYIPKAAQDALYHAQKCHKFMHSIVPLLQEQK